MKNFKKIEEEDFYSEDFELEKYVDNKIKYIIECETIEYKNNLIEGIIGCESPIEQMLAIAMKRIQMENILKYNPYIDIVAIDNQAEIMCNDKKYRVDFLITVDYKEQEYKFFIIECDGYEFHQKTKEQVERDNKRQRLLQKEGYEVIRFSGSEIWNKPLRCANEILQIIISYCGCINE